MKTKVAVLSVVVSLMASAASAMSVQEFLTTTDRIPRNPTALLRSDTRRLMNEMKTAFKTVGDEQKAAQVAGRRPATCVPAGARISLSAENVLARFNAIPPARRNTSVTQAVREWMAHDYPCA
ncbi:hypothetical protein [Brevundimonas sp. SORGH_AS_0993]|uniref:hypothetical protein n=1 Tax=Brevundimonas sp. SORGH_AS_0993 TaxID=3041794 RepID=UPI002788104C|nr:hypothetical protein [Brevundimonas sp. SORGH_AS_0993]MDQ1153208.1 hypothetical protein [Brevundimonas sp. SORGH_AS_0993]